MLSLKSIKHSPYHFFREAKHKFLGRLHVDILRFSSVLLVFLLSACSAKYHASGETPTGYGHSQLSETVYEVYYRESDRASWETLHEFVLQRSAEIAKERGFPIFDVRSKREQRIFLESAPSSINIANNNSDTTAGPEIVATGMLVDGRQVVYEIELLEE